MSLNVSFVHVKIWNGGGRGRVDKMSSFSDFGIIVIEKDNLYLTRAPIEAIAFSNSDTQEAPHNYYNRIRKLDELFKELRLSPCVELLAWNQKMGWSWRNSGIPAIPYQLHDNGFQWSLWKIDLVGPKNDHHHARTVLGIRWVWW